MKFQTHIACAESTLSEPWRVEFSRQDKTRYDYWKRMEFSEEQWRGLKKHAEEQGLIFLSSPFSVEAVELLNRVGVTAWKVADQVLLGMRQRMRCQTAPSPITPTPRPGRRLWWSVRADEALPGENRRPGLVKGERDAQAFVIVFLSVEIAALFPSNFY